MTYLEIIITVTMIASVGNLILQSTWFKWSYGIHKRKHKEDE